MKVSDVMTQEVISVAPDCSVAHAAAIMLEERISGLPVIDPARGLVGIVTEGDLLRRAETGTEKPRPRWLELLIGSGVLAEEYTRAHGRKVSEVMTTNVAVVSEDEAVSRVVEIMERRRVKRLPVVRGNRVVGIIARANLLRALAAIPQECAIYPNDARIRMMLEKELARQPWKPVQSNIIVHNGCVDIWGAILDDRHRDAIRVAAENMEGVREVRDHLVYIPTYGVGI